MFLLFYVIFIKSEENIDRTQQNGGPYYVESQYDVSISNSYFHDFSFNQDSYENSVVTVLFNSGYNAMTFYLSKSSFSNCRGSERTLFNTNEKARLVFNENCIYDCHANLYGPLLYLKTQFSGPSAQQILYLTAAHCTSSYHLIHLEFGLENAIPPLEFKNSNISRCESTYFGSDIPQYGLVQIFNFNQETYANTFEYNKGIGCGIILFYDANRKKSNMGIFHHCNFLENEANSAHTYLYAYFCTIRIYDCNFCNNQISQYLMFNDQSDVQAYDLTYENYLHTGVYSNNYVSVGQVWNNNNLHSHTHFATRGFCAAAITIYSPTPIQTPYTTPYTTPLTTPLTTPFTTPYTTPLTTPYTTPLTAPLTTPFITPYTTPFVTPATTPSISEEIKTPDTPTPNTPTPDTPTPNTPTPDTPTPDTPTPNTPTPNIPTQSQESQNAGYSNVDDQPKDDNSSMLYIIIGCCIAALIIIIAIIVFIIYRRRHQDESSSNQSIEMEADPVVLSTDVANDNLTTVSLFSTNIEESDPFAQDFEEHNNFIF